MDFYLIVKNAYALYCVYHQKSVLLQRLFVHTQSCMRFSLVFLIGFHRYDDICKLFIVCVLFFGQKAHDFNIKIVILHCFVKTMFIDVTMTLWKKRHCTLCFWSFELPLQFSIKDKCRGDASEVYIRTQPVVCKRVYTLMHTFRVYHICL